MDKFQLKSQFSENIIKVKFELDHIWANILGIECKSSATEAYLLDFHKSIYIKFNLLNILLMYNKKPVMSPFI
jgi:hypothetical protein